MKLLSLTTFLVLVTFVVIGSSSPIQAGHNFWTSEDESPTPTEVPKIPPEFLTASPTPVIVPAIQAVPPTPTPRPGLKAIDPTAAALFSVVVPGSGQVYAGDPLKGIVIAALFGVGLWQTIDNLSLQQINSGLPQTQDVNGTQMTTTGTLQSKDEVLGSLEGLATLAIYGYQIQDASDISTQYNKKNYLTFNLGISPRPNARLAYMF
ncbi:MAG TPA: hypothetical protein VN963_10270 [bacterium]|nr:hypothetical protein [bacterium]